MKGSIDLYMRFMEHPPFAGMILICRIIVPENVIVCVNPLDPGLDDRDATPKARKFCYVTQDFLPDAIIRKYGAFWCCKRMPIPTSTRSSSHQRTNFKLGYPASTQS